MSHRPYWTPKDNIPFAHEALKSIKIHLPWHVKNKEKEYSTDRFFFIPLGLFTSLRRFSPDVVISTEIGIRTLLALIYTISHGKKILVWSDEYLRGTEKHSSLRLTTRRLLIKAIDGFCSCGIENRK